MNDQGREDTARLDWLARLGPDDLASGAEYKWYVQRERAAPEGDGIILEAFESDDLRRAIDFGRGVYDPPQDEAPDEWAEGRTAP